MDLCLGLSFVFSLVKLNNCFFIFLVIEIKRVECRIGKLLRIGFKLSLIVSVYYKDNGEINLWFIIIKFSLLYLIVL